MTRVEQSISLAVVRDEYDRVLLVQRRIKERLHDGSILSWAFPGGKIEDKEFSRDTAIREVHEETGYRVQALGLIYSGLHAVNQQLHVDYWRCSPVYYDANVEPDPAIAQPKWIPAQKLSSFITSPLNMAVAASLCLNSASPLCKES